MCLSALRGQRGVVATFLLTVLSAAGTVILVGFESVRTAPEYTRSLQIATDLRQNPNSHSQAIVDASARELLTLLIQSIQDPDCPDCPIIEVPPCCEYPQDANPAADSREGPGLRELLTAVDTQQDIRTQLVIIKAFVGPATPLAGVDATVTVTVLNSDTNTPVAAGTRVSYTIGFLPFPSLAGVKFTDAAGTVQLHVRGKVRDTVENFTFTAGGVTEEFSYTYR